MVHTGIARRGLPWLIALGALTLTACQGANSNFASPRPRSREAAGEQAGLPPAGNTSNRLAIDSSGGEVKFRLCTLTVPVGALPETIFIEIAEPPQAPKDVLPESGYQINPDGLELQKEALLRIGYFDEDVPEGRQESDLVIAHQVNGVWVELGNSQVHVHNNVVEAPVTFLGLYALRARTIDSRTMNTPPLAAFEYSDQPFAGMTGKPFEQAKQEMEAKGQAAPAAGAAAGEGGSAAGAGGQAGQGGAGAGGEAQPGAAGEAQPGAGGSAAPGEAGQAGQDQTDQGGEGAADDQVQSRVVEKCVVAGPEQPAHNGKQDQTASKNDGQAGPDAKSGAGKAGNVAESKPKKKPVAEKAAQPPAAKEQPAGAGVEGGNEEAPAEAGAQAKTAATAMYFDASKSSDADGQVTQYDWDFDADGVFDFTSHSGPYAKHTFLHNGDYTVVLKVTDNGRYAQSGYATNVLRVRNPQAEPAPLAAHITAYPPTGPCPLTVNFGATASGGTPPYVYRWTFSDGSESNLPNPFTTYPKPGTHAVRFSVTDVAGAKLDGSVAVQSVPGPAPGAPLPRIMLDVSPGSVRGQAPLTTKFRLAFDRATTPVTYRVLFGDEGPDAEATSTTDSELDHVYPNTGFYIMKAIATDAGLRTASTFATVYAYSPEMARDFTPSAAGVGGDPFSFGHGMHITFDYTETSPRMVRFGAQDTPHPPDKLGYQWDFGDGTFATEQKPTHTYARDGVYEVRLTVSDDVVRWRHRIWLPVSGKQPAIAIQRPPYVEGPAPLRLNFDAIVTRAEEPLRYEWAFGDARRQDAGTFYVFQLPGDYKVDLTAYDRNNDPLRAPEIEVRVRSGGASYRMPLAVIEPVSSSTRVSVIDYNSAYPLPLSSPQLEGPATLVDLAPDGERVAIVSDDGLIVKTVASAQPVVAFLPAAGKITAVAALERDAAYATVQTAGGPLTYLLRPQGDPLLAGKGVLLDASGDGKLILLKPSAQPSAEAVSLISVDPGAGQVGEVQPLAKAFDAKLTRDGRYAFFINDESRLVKRNLSTGGDEFLSGGDDRKSALSIAADGSACAFASQLGDRKDMIYGRYDDSGAFRLASLTGQTKLYSEHFRLSAGGQYMMLYGSREATLALLKAARGKTVADDELNGEAAPEESGKGRKPRAERQRYGILRVDLSAAPDDWSITKVSPRFIVECTAQFDYAGPFT